MATFQVIPENPRNHFKATVGADFTLPPGTDPMASNEWREGSVQITPSVHPDADLLAQVSSHGVRLELRAVGEAATALSFWADVIAQGATPQTRGELVHTVTKTLLEKLGVLLIPDLFQETFSRGE